MKEHWGEELINPTDKKANFALTREMLFLAEQSAESGITVLPGKDWALHYKLGDEERSDKLTGLMSGQYSAADVAGDIKPDALFYNIDDIKDQGLNQVGAKIRDLSSFIKHYDYERYADFIESMRESGASLHDLTQIYNELTQARIQKKMMDAYGYTGRAQIEKTLETEASDIKARLSTQTAFEKVLKTLKLSWISEDLHLTAAEDRDRALSALSGVERDLFNKIQKPYQDYIHSGNEASYSDLIKSLEKELIKVERKSEPQESSESMKELEKELEQYKEEAVNPGLPEDPAIPPEDSDEYHTPPSSGEQGKEKIKEQPIFEITPPLGGYYASGKKSYYDSARKTWSKKKNLTPYSTEHTNKNRFGISGVFDTGLKSLPLPTGYCLDNASLKVSGGTIKLLRDQNGCFYLEAKGNGSFSVEFVKEDKVFINKPVNEDLALLTDQSFSEKTEQCLKRLVGSPLQKAEQLRQYMLANHFYPGGGDLNAAQALQYKLRSESSAENYLQNIDTSEYLECYSANTKFVALARRSGIPSRLVVGHKVEGSKEGKSSITGQTGHAWSEIWDGTQWRRFDATPQAKPEDKKKEEKTQDEETKKESAPEADDGGIDAPPQSRQGEKGETEKTDTKADQKSDQTSSTESGNPLDQMQRASDAEMQTAEQQLEHAKDQMDKMEKLKESLIEKLNETQKFNDLAEMSKEIEQSDLLDEMKQELEDKLEAKEEQMLDAMKESLEKMTDDGFMDEKKLEKLLEKFDQKKLEELDKLQKEIERERGLYDAYERIQEEIKPLVEEWFRYFAERLPHQEDVEIDEDSLTRQGSFNRRSVMKPRNLLFGIVKNPRQIRPSIKPRFMASILVDVSGSMSGPKLESARKLLIFYSELFNKISEEFGYIRFSIDTFSDTITEIKKFDQEYESPRRYDFKDGPASTIKARLMERVQTSGGTNMLDGIKKAAHDLNEQTTEFPDYASAFYFVGDGGDTCGNAQNIKNFLQINDSERGFGEHMYSAILLGNESQRREIADIFGDEHTNVAPDFDKLIEQSMNKFEDDLEEYLKNKTQSGV